MFFVLELSSNNSQSKIYSFLNRIIIKILLTTDYSNNIVVDMLNELLFKKYKCVFGHTCKSLLSSKRLCSNIIIFVYLTRII